MDIKVQEALADLEIPDILGGKSIYDKTQLYSL